MLNGKWQRRKLKEGENRSCIAVTLVTMYQTSETVLPTANVSSSSVSMPCSRNVGGRHVPTGMLYGSVVEHVDMTVEAMQSIVVWLEAKARHEWTLEAVRCSAR